jgi:hypothetical protein
VDDALYARLLQATVCIAPQGEAFRGCGVLIDPDSKLVVTVAEVMGASENARAWPATVRSGDTQGQIHSSMETEIAARVVHRDETRQLILLQLEHLPVGLAALPMGEWTGSLGQSLYSVCLQDLNLSANGDSSWSHSRGQLRQIIMLPHY